MGIVGSPRRRERLLLNRRNFNGGLVALCSALSPARLFAAEPAGRVETLKGQSTAALDGTERELAVASDLFLQELVQTFADARLEMALGEETRVHLGERTRLKIEQSVVDQGGMLVLERGAMLFDKPDEGRTRGAVVRTPFAIIAARGTRFFVGPSNNVIGVFVERGAVTVQNNGGAVTLEAGEGTNLVSPDTAPTPATEWGAPRIAAALASVT